VPGSLRLIWTATLFCLGLQTFGGALPEALRDKAEQGAAAAQYTLAWMYDHGSGVPKDTGEAVKWYRRAADQGSAEARTNLGRCYAGGGGVPQDMAEAAKWYRKAADQGHALALIIRAKVGSSHCEREALISEDRSRPADSAAAGAFGCRLPETRTWARLSDRPDAKGGGRKS